MGLEGRAADNELLLDFVVRKAETNQAQDFGLAARKWAVICRVMFGCVVGYEAAQCGGCQQGLASVDGLDRIDDPRGGLVSFNRNPDAPARRAR